MSKFNECSDKQILLANPYDSDNNLDSFFDQKSFYENNLYFESEQIRELKYDFKEAITCKSDFNRIIYLIGYAGNGKTSFINDFIYKEKENFDHYLLNIEEVSHRTDEDITTQIKSLLRSNLMYDPALKIALKTIYQYRNTFKHHLLISDYFFDNIQKIQDKEQNDFLDWALNLKIRDLFSIFYTVLFNKIDVEKHAIIYFDNLDVIAVESIVDDFIKVINQSLIDGNKINQYVFKEKKIQFLSKVKFVFCVRDENDPLIISHLKSKIQANVKKLRLSLDAHCFSSIISQRIEFVKDIKYNRRDDEIIDLRMDVMKSILEQGYFRTIILPLFNFDYRDTVNFLHEISIKISNINVHPFKNRGIVLHTLIMELMSSNFMRRYLQLHTNDRGFCYIDRVMLTVLINEGKYWKKDTYHHLTHEYSLKSLLSDLLKIKYYDKNEILRSIASCFLFHTNDWVHLLTLINYPIENEDEFIRKINNKSVEELEEIKVKINPSGFSYVRHLLPHFEFYSSFVRLNRHCMINSTSLYDENLILNDKGRYYFQDKISNVFKLVSIHEKTMNLFYVKHYGFLKNFHESKYAFKHFGKNALGGPAGYFHISRIITQHVGYIDEFRQYLINDQKNKGRYVDLNKKLVFEIEKYVKLLSDSSDVKAKKKFVPKWSKSIKMIKNSNFTDCTISINSKNE